MESIRLHVLIVDDETNIRKTLGYFFSTGGHLVTAVGNAVDAVEEARRRLFDLVFLDLKLGKQSGMDLIPVLLSESPRTKIVVITAHASIESAVEAMRRGAADYIVKPFELDQIKLLVQRIQTLHRLESELETLRQSAQRSGPEERLQSLNVEMNRMIEISRKAAASEATVLLCGESGTGKTAFAKAIHRWSPRARKPMGIVACPAIPSELLESELFGHAKGSFTGALRDNPGRIASCEGGTLFLDEIGDMALSVQAKLLRFIQDREYERLGEQRVRLADVRIIAATNSDLERRVAEGRFREDLFYRLNVIRITIPPLRSRREDILPLAKGFLVHFCQVNGNASKTFTEAAETALVNYNWPGNVRELRNTIERAVILGVGDHIDISDLSRDIVPHALPPGIGDRVPLSTIEELHIRRIIANTSSLQEAADILGIDQVTLWRKRKFYGI
ncbi:MAG: sigma-54 dependent transcriptional regulator [Thermodesulfobacteriota bacterium]